MIVTLTEFNTYTGNMENTSDVNSMKERFLKSAQEIVSHYLGYSVENSDYDDFICGIGQPMLYLFANPITQITTLTVSGVAVSSDSYSIKGHGLRLNDGVWPVGIDNIHAVYKAGWSSQTIPDSVKQAILQIASLLLQEAGGNIGITGKTMSENSRTFINYTNFDKWLDKIDEYKIVRLV